MKARFGFIETPREVIVELPEDADLEKLKASIESAIGTQKVRVLWVADRNGRTYGISPDNLAYVEIDPQADDSRIGFGSA